MNNNEETILFNTPMAYWVTQLVNLITNIFIFITFNEVFLILTITIHHDNLATLLIFMAVALHYFRIKNTFDK